MRVRPISSKVPDPIGNWTLKVRLNVNGNGHFLPPPAKKGDTKPLYVTVPFGWEVLRNSLNAHSDPVLLFEGLDFPN